MTQPRVEQLIVQEHSKLREEQDEPSGLPGRTLVLDCELLSQPFTDSGNAERLVSLHGRDIRFCPEMKKWLVWDGWRWNSGDARRIKLLAKRTMRQMYTQAGDIEKASQKYLKFPRPHPFRDCGGWGNREHGHAQSCLSQRRQVRQEDGGGLAGPVRALPIGMRSSGRWVIRALAQRERNLRFFSLWKPFFPLAAPRQSV